MKAHAARIADLLLAWLENSDTPFTDTLLARANAIAARLWDLVERDTPPAGCESWHSEATGRTAGILARYLLRQRSSILRERPGAVSQTFVAEVRDALSTIAQDPSVAGKGEYQKVWGPSGGGGFWGEPYRGFTEIPLLESCEQPSHMLQI